MSNVTDAGALLAEAQKYLNGGTAEPAKVLALYTALKVSEPRAATQLVRELARLLLTRQARIKRTDADKLWKACKEAEAFGFARRILGRLLQRWKEQIDFGPNGHDEGAPSDTKLRQEQALCTSKDPDLSAAMRHDWALAILRPDEEGALNDPETQGIAGGIWKRRWEWDADRTSLERSLTYYRRGMGETPEQIKRNYYPAINCAFVLDQLAGSMRDSTSAAHYKNEAGEIRGLLVDIEDEDLWRAGTRTEALLGLGRIDEAVPSMQRYMSFRPQPWELETTLRQFVRLGQLRGISPAALNTVLMIAMGRVGEAPSEDPRLKSVHIGRVGLALSGGGFRASLYHLGVLSRLAEADILRHVEVISCVSGGSILGAHYYLELRKQLSQHGEKLGRDDYANVVDRVSRAFVDGVSKNVRTQVLSTLKGCHAVVSGKDVKYAGLVARIIHETFYKDYVEEKTMLHELLVQPQDAPHNFHPGRHNWERHNKVPTLTLNAATLNNGHSWQFTARSMGESPFSVQPAVDSNSRLRRANYNKDIAGRWVRLCDAVAVSACVPGLFAPLQLDGVYDRYKVRLVDGGVFDNQGAAGLLEQDCQVLFVSDASGQLGTLLEADGGHVAPLLRSIDIFQERMRQSGYEGLVKRREAGQIRALAYVHLTQGLTAAPTNWVGCEDPHEPDDQLPADETRGGFGVAKELQRHLAGMRTDLDTFSEVECAALMASGYLAMGAQLNALFLRIPMMDTGLNQRDWLFTPLIPAMAGTERLPQAHERLKVHIEAGASGIGRSMKLDKQVRYIVNGLLAVVALAVFALACVYWSHPLLTVGGLVILLLTLAIPWLVQRFFGKKISSRIVALVLDPRHALQAPLQSLAGTVLLYAYAKIMIGYIDPGYRKRGTLKAILG